MKTWINDYICYLSHVPTYSTMSHHFMISCVSTTWVTNYVPLIFVEVVNHLWYKHITGVTISCVESLISFRISDVTLFLTNRGYPAYAWQIGPFWQDTLEIALMSNLPWSGHIKFCWTHWGWDMHAYMHRWTGSSSIHSKPHTHY